jgi:hypothetical protein
MAKTKKEEDKKPARKHRLKKITTEEADDGSFVHHHEYQTHDGHKVERRNVATSQTPDEAGEHTAEQFGMNPDAAQPAAAPALADPGGDAGSAPAAAMMGS